MVEQTTELDCHVGYPRPGDLIYSVIEGTCLPKKRCSKYVFWNVGLGL